MKLLLTCSFLVSTLLGTLAVAENHIMYRCGTYEVRSQEIQNGRIFEVYIDFHDSGLLSGVLTWGGVRIVPVNEQAALSLVNLPNTNAPGAELCVKGNLTVADYMWKPYASVLAYEVIVRDRNTLANK